MAEIADLQKPATSRTTFGIPASVCMPINRCNYPASILASQTFQDYPEPVSIDHVMTFHHYLFQRLDELNDPRERALLFDEYMQVSFLLGHPDEMGYEAETQKVRRHKSDYKRLLRGWMFDSDSREGAVIKGWVESRFGLKTQNHKGRLGQGDSDRYLRYSRERSQGLYNTNGLESQLDLLYSYCQYELSRRERQHHFSLYRGTNSLNAYETVATDNRDRVVVLNNLTSFSDNPELSDSFGDYLFSCSVPYSKILFFPELLPGQLKCENEFLVIGGLYRIRVLPA